MQLGVQKDRGTMYVCLFLYVYMYICTCLPSSIQQQAMRQRDSPTFNAQVVGTLC